MEDQNQNSGVLNNEGGVMDGQMGGASGMDAQVVGGADDAVSTQVSGAATNGAADGETEMLSEAELADFLADRSEDEMLELFVEQILVDKGYVSLDVATRKRFIAEMKEQLAEYINEAIVAALPDDKLDELSRNLDEGTATPENINALVEESGVDVAEVVQKTMMEFREAYLGASVTV